MAPPLPAASQPSKTTMVESPRRRAFRWRRFSRPCALASATSYVAFSTVRDMSRPASVAGLPFPRPRPKRAASRVRRREHAGHGGAAAGPPVRVLFVQPPGHAIAEGARDDEAAVAFVGSVHQRPRRLARIGQAHCRGLGLDQLVVRPCLTPLLGGDPPARQRVAFERLEARVLRVAVEVHHELQNQRAVVGQQLLEARDALQLAPELRGRWSRDAPAGRWARRTTRS